MGFLDCDLTKSVKISLNDTSLKEVSVVANKHNIFKFENRGKGLNIFFLNEIMFAMKCVGLFENCTDCFLLKSGDELGPAVSITPHLDCRSQKRKYHSL